MKPVVDMSIRERQRALTDKLLFEYYLVNSVREEQVFSPFSYYLDRKVFDEMLYSADILNKLVKRIIAKAVENPEAEVFEYGCFPMREEILKLTVELLPFFWARYDAFQRADGGIFFSEFNYDKPCAQRETAISDMLGPMNNPNGRFISKFNEAFRNICNASKTVDGRPSVAILVDPGHYEEVHLAQLYMDILEPVGCDFIIAGGSNLYVEDDRVFSFGRPVDIILRQFPAEYLHELPYIKDILRLHNEGRVIMMNDPRAIIGQSKSLFAYLWELAEKESQLLAPEELKVIKAVIPYTRIFTDEQAEYIRANKDKLVLKAAYGRYSEEVYIGCMCDTEEWDEVLEYVSESGDLHVVQEFCPIKRERILRFDGVGYEDCDAFGNFGIYMINGEFSGICARWSSDYLSCDDVVWGTAVGVREKSLKIVRTTEEGRERLWRKINDEAAFKWGYTDNYTSSWESFVLDGLMLDSDMYDEIKEATGKAVSVIKKVAALVQDNSGLLCPVLGISGRLAELVSKHNTDLAAFIGRFDWVTDSAGRLKLLEFNAETPAGLLESMVIGRLVKESLGAPGENPCESLGALIEKAFTRIIGDYSKDREIRTIGLVSSSYHEDWYNTTIIYELLRMYPYRFLLGDVAGLEGGNGKLRLYGEELDAVYRYYPLDWFDNDSYFDGVLEALDNETLSINPPSTLIYQSKAFFALLWELLGKGFYTEEEGRFIEKYIPKTTLAPRLPDAWDFCSKPFFGREGGGITFGSMPGELPENGEYVLQERIDIQPVELDLHSPLRDRREIMYPVIGTYVAGDEFAGIFTRVGSRITDKWSIYLPTYINKGN